MAVLPTYNEAANVVGLLERLFALPLDGFEAVVVDDASPDGTAALAAGLRPRFPGLYVLSRRGPAGRGLAGKDGFLFALERGADLILEMDADLSHEPEQAIRLIDAAASGGCDIALGSRLISGGSDDRPAPRRMLTRAATAYARAALGLRLRDVNSGFRCFRREALLALEPATLRSRGPAILHETLFRAARRGLRVVEVPIDFVDRRQGRSKLDAARLAAGALWVLRLRLGL